MSPLLLGISGSIRPASYNTRLLRAAARLLPPGPQLRLWPGLAAVPPYDESRDLEPAPRPVSDLRVAIAGADAVLIATPEYNASIPGVLKNAVDWASRPFPSSSLRGKPVAVIGASTGIFGAVWAQAELRKVLDSIGADVLEAELSVPQVAEAFACDGRLRDPALETVLAGIVAALSARSTELAAGTERSRSPVGSPA